MLRIFCISWFETFQVCILYGTSTYGYKDVCTHTLSICGIYSKPFTVWAAHLPRPACQPVTQSAKYLPNLPTAQDCPGPYRPKLLHRDSGFNSLGANTGTHILLSWHSSRMPHSITNFAWSILQLTAEIHCQFKWNMTRLSSQVFNHNFFCRSGYDTMGKTTFFECKQLFYHWRTTVFSSFSVRVTWSERLVHWIFA